MELRKQKPIKLWTHSARGECQGGLYLIVLLKLMVNLLMTNLINRIFYPFILYA